VGVTIDDTPFGASSSPGGGDFMVPDLDPADLQHIEVLRGSQGRLYGASSMGGLIKYVTVAPDTDSFAKGGDPAGVMACAEPARTASRLILFSDYPFKLGVASGTPSADGFVLWTRLCPDPLHEGGIATQASRKKEDKDSRAGAYSLFSHVAQLRSHIPGD
jgi:hypothetical protein